MTTIKDDIAEAFGVFFEKFQKREAQRQAEADKQVWEYSKEELAEKYAIALCEIDRLLESCARVADEYTAWPAREIAARIRDKKK